MRYLRYLSLTFLLLISACHYRDQMVVIDSAAPTLGLDRYYNKTLNLKVVDNRPNKEFIGFRTPVSIWKLEEEYKNPDYFSGYNTEFQYKIANLNNDQDLAMIVQKKLSDNLNQRGLKLKRFTINQLSVAIEELSVIPTMYRTGVYSKIKVKASNKDNDLEKVYEKKIISHEPMIGALVFGPFNPGQSEEYYNRIINDCLNQNIQSIISDNQLWSFLD